MVLIAMVKRLLIRQRVLPGLESGQFAVALTKSGQRNSRHGAFLRFTVRR